MAITCKDPTPNFPTGRKLLEWADTDGNGVINESENIAAVTAYLDGTITKDEMLFIHECITSYGGNLDAMCPPGVAPQVNCNQYFRAQYIDELGLPRGIANAAVTVWLSPSLDLVATKYTGTDGSTDKFVLGTGYVYHVQIAASGYETTGKSSFIACYHDGTVSGHPCLCITLTPLEPEPGTCTNFFTVKNKATGQLIDADSITVNGTAPERITVGSYSMKLIPGEFYEVRVSKNGYEDAYVGLTACNDLTIELTPLSSNCLAYFSTLNEPYFDDSGNLIISYTCAGLESGQEYIIRAYVTTNIGTTGNPASSQVMPSGTLIISALWLANTAIQPYAGETITVHLKRLSDSRICQIQDLTIPTSAGNLSFYLSDVSHPSSAMAGEQVSIQGTIYNDGERTFTFVAILTNASHGDQMMYIGLLPVEPGGWGTYSFDYVMPDFPLDQHDFIVEVCATATG